MAVGSCNSSGLGPAACEKDAKALELIEEITRNADAVQERVLSEILTRNGDTEYLQRYKMGGATDRETFKCKIPVVTYENLHPDIQRIANGDRSAILSAHPISEFLTSSGTSAGERKLMPTTEEEMDRKHWFSNLLIPVMNLYVAGLDKGKGLYFLCIKSETTTPGGLMARPVLTSFYKSNQFKTRAHNSYTVYTSPDEVILCQDSFQSMYTHLLCGLHQRQEVLRIGAVFASGLLRAIHFLHVHYKELAHDIATGTLNQKITEPSVREAVSSINRPSPQLAQWITDEFSGGNLKGIITRIWPNTKYLDVIVTGAMAQYIPTLTYYSNGLPMACTMYASSECFFGLNLRPICKPSQVSYTIMPNMGFFEFIPQDSSSSVSSYDPKRDPPPPLVDLSEVEVGHEYEIVVTTYAGLCRYRVGDVLRVTGFFNSAPYFQFVRRKNVLLSVDSDKTDESELQRAVENASELLREFDTTVVEYTSCADTKTIPGHYVIYWELLLKEPSKGPTNEALERCCLAMEDSLNSVYRQGRVECNSIGPLEIRVVKNGTFEELMDYAISRGASINQYKVPRCVNFTPIMELLDSRVLSAHFSQVFPRWTPKRR